MKVLRKILYALLLFFVLCCALIGLCAMNPEMSEKIAETLRVEEWKKDSESADTDSDADTDMESVADNNADNEADNDNDAESVEPPTDVVVTGTSGSSEKPVYETARDPESNVVQNVSTRVDQPVYGIIAPSAVAGKNGYEPVQGINNEIDDEEAALLQNEIDEGETGDGLTFDALFYPYYTMLDDAGKHLYRQIYANAMALNDRFSPVEDVSVNSLRNIFAAVYNDHPELFWVDTAYSCKYKRNGQCAEIDLQFNDTVQNLPTEIAVFEANAKEIVNAARGLGNNYEREKYVHDALIDKVDYVDSAPMNQSAYSALVNGRTVCAGYARAYQYMMQQLSIPCYYCTGYAGERHAWNIVGLDDGYYNVDATWDDTEDGTYDYFNKTDADYARTHIRQELSINLPPCNGTFYGNLEAKSDEDGDGDDDDDANDEVVDYRRRLSDLGLYPDNPITTIGDYYNTCYDLITENGKGNYTFQILLYGKPVFQDVYTVYQTEAYRSGYMDRALSDIDASFYLITWVIEELQDGYYLVTHEILTE